MIYELYYRLCPPQIIPTIRCCSQHLMVGVFFLTSFPILDLEHFSQVILRIVLQIMPPPKLTQPSGAVHSIWWLGFFFDLFSSSGLRAFFTSDFTNCTTDYAPPPQPSGAVHSNWWLGFFFFDLFSYSGLRAFFTSDLKNCTTDYAPPKLPQPSGAVHSNWWLGFFFWPLLLFWT